MLVLTRRVNEAILIAGRIMITVNQISGQRVKLGVKAPACTRVAGSEVLGRQPAELDKHTAVSDDLVVEAASR